MIRLRPSQPDTRKKDDMLVNDPALRITDRYVFFWGGWPSQWHKSKFVIDRVRYNCCEQYMMAEKARLFGDRDAERDILREHDPRKQKALGREVRRFDEESWRSVCRAIVYSANLAKFEQNADLRELLLKTSPRTLVEASPSDSIWGIGLAKDDLRADQPEQWPGTNWLGIALGQVRETLEARDAGRTYELDESLAAQTQALNRMRR